MSNITFTGRIVADVELRWTTTAQPKPILQFPVYLYTGGSKDAGYKTSQRIFVDVWDNAEELNKTLKKGDTVTITGTCKPPRTFKGKDGQEKSAGFEVTAQVVEMGDMFRDQPAGEPDSIPF